MAATAPPFAFVTLLTSDAYLPGALTLAGALKEVHPSPPTDPEVDFHTVCLVTPESVDVATVKQLRRVFDLVVGVEIIAQEDDKGLKLLGRLDLNTVLTKLHVFRLTQYSKIIFLDADVLPIRPLSHLFTLPHEFSAVPDVGWPDIFNSGVLVLSPGEDKFTELNQLLKSKGTWDGGDQGILNEWRGGNWNRLSFTYNTTPTAAYTYAPAYERFGSQISAIHFIGPNKPWNSLSHRPAFQSHDSQTSGPLQVYDYNGLLDRWFAVYDKYCRAPPTVSESDFQVKRYISAWDEQTGTSSDLISASMASGTALGLEDLRRIAVGGMTASAGSSTNEQRPGDGAYISLPLEGRFDLMQEQPGWTDHGTPSTPPAGYTRIDSPSTPGPDEVPPSPHIQTIPLPPTTPTSVSYPHPPRPASPPMLIWNPAVDPPPTTTPSASAFPSETYFPNIWDQAPTHHRTQGPARSSPTPVSDAFFQPPPPSDIPISLRQQGHYRQVKHVFPWEEKPRQMPGRVFPASDAPSPSLFTSPGLPTTLTYANAWDTVPSIQKYASRLVRPSQPPIGLAPAFEGDQWKARSWEERTEASKTSKSSGSVTTRSRGSSISAPYTIKGKKKEYRVRGVQTISPKMRSQGTQVAFDPPKVSTHDKKSSRHDGRRRGASESTVHAGLDLSMTTASPSPVLQPGSPREFICPLQTSTPPPRAAAVERQISNDGSLTSPPSVAAVWDPARGVELFKRGSEEVLARFLKMGSWEEEAVQ
ncbi:glycogenin [Mycena rebaudengoi]|nr:glycogenin [Mycena rebaudengoi]